MNSIIIGLTGPTGAGKSVVALQFSMLGCKIIDCDRIAREVTSECDECIEQLSRKFGCDIIKNDGTLDRNLLAKRAFSSDENVLELNHVTHPFILIKVKDEIEKFKSNGDKFIIIDAPLLIESGANKFCDKVVSVIAPEAIRLNRILIRDKINKDLAEKRINAQHKDDYYTKNADFVIDGTNNIDEISKDVQRIIKTIIGDANEKT